MRLAIMALVASLAATPADAETWKLVGDNTTLPAIVVFVDYDSVVRNGDIASFKVRLYTEGEMPETDKLFIHRREASCSNYSYFMLDQQYYIGNLPESDDSVPSKIIQPPDGTIDRSLIDMVCGRRQYLSGPISDTTAYASDYFSDLAAEEGY